MAKLPESLVKTPDRQLSSVEVGETVFLDPSDMLVDAERNCFLDLKATVHPKKSILNNMRVIRKEEGFHVAILVPQQWPLSVVTGKDEKIVAVASFTEDPDPELDLGGRVGRLKR